MAVVFLDLKMERRLSSSSAIFWGDPVAFQTFGFLPKIILPVTLALFSVASGVGSVAFKDVLAKTIPKGKRGRLLAARATCGGLLTLIAGSIFRLYIVDSQSLVPYLILIAGAAVLWGIASLCFAAIIEEKGANAGDAMRWEKWRPDCG